LVSEDPSRSTPAIRAEANGQRQQSGHCKRRTLAQQSRGIFQLPAKLIKEVQAQGFPAIRFDVDAAAKLFPYLARRLLARHAGTHQIVRILLDVEAQLLGHPLFEIAAPRKHGKQRTQALDHLRPPPAGWVHWVVLLVQLGV
jgi:hypothetical protein